MERTVRAKMQGNSIVITIPKDIFVEPNTEFKISKNSDNQLILTPIKRQAQSLTELFADWHGEYKRAEDLGDWDALK